MAVSDIGGLSSSTRNDPSMARKGHRTLADRYLPLLLVGQSLEKSFHYENETCLSASTTPACLRTGSISGCAPTPPWLP